MLLHACACTGQRVLLAEPSLSDRRGSGRSRKLTVQQSVLCQSLEKRTNTPSVIHKGICIQHKSSVEKFMQRSRLCALYMCRPTGVPKEALVQDATSCCWLPLILRPLSVRRKKTGELHVSEEFWCSIINKSGIKPATAAYGEFHVVKCIC